MALRVTDPRDDKTRIEYEKGGLFTDSYVWVFKNDTFKQWYGNPEEHLLWIKGDLGKGKTMLLCGIIKKLELDNPRTSAYFFFQATEGRINTAMAALRSLIYLLVKNQPHLISHVRSRYDDTGIQLFTDGNRWEALSKIFDGILNDAFLKTRYIIIDALDECIEDQDILLGFIIQKSASFSNVKWIVSSRNWPDIEKHLDTAIHKVKLHLELNPESISAAVNVYILFKVDQLSTRQRYDQTTKEEVYKYLISNAMDTFLWVALVCKNLENVSRRHVSAKLTSFPPGLGPLYRRMLGLTHQIHDPGDASLCKQILSVVSVVRRPITLEELTTLADIPDTFTANDFEEIIEHCGSFLSLRGRTIFFIHQSAKDFLLEQAADEIFPSGREEIHSEIVCRSLKIMEKALQRDIYHVGNPAITVRQIKKLKQDSLATIRYSFFHWVGHLTDAKHRAILQDGGLVDSFLRKKFLHWVEAFLYKYDNSARQFNILTTQLRILVRLGFRKVRSHYLVIYYFCSRSRLPGTGKHLPVPIFHSGSARFYRKIFLQICVSSSSVI